MKKISQAIKRFVLYLLATIGALFLILVIWEAYDLWKPKTLTLAQIEDYVSVSRKQVETNDGSIIFEVPHEWTRVERGDDPDTFARYDAAKHGVSVTCYFVDSEYGAEIVDYKPRQTLLTKIRYIEEVDADVLYMVRANSWTVLVVQFYIDEKVCLIDYSFEPRDLPSTIHESYLVSILQSIEIHQGEVRYHRFE